VYGLRVRSEVALSGWPVATPGEPDVRVVEARCDGPEAGCERYAARTLVEDRRVKLHVRGVGRYCALDGSRIEVDPEPGARAEDLQLYLTGALVGAVLHQRGVWPLHASAVAIDGEAVAVAGASGAGKSTLVAKLVDRGATLVTDDLTVTALLEAGGVGVRPGPGRIKLDGRSLAEVAAAGRRLGPAGGSRGKYEVGVTRVSLEPVPLRRIYLLGDGRLNLTPLRGLEAVAALVEHTYFLGFAHSLGLGSQVFRLAAGVAGRVTVKRLDRPRGLEYLEAIAELIERDARG
jgi:hypothetical protein